MKKRRNVYRGMSALFNRTAPRHDKEVATAVCAVSSRTRDAANAMAIVLVPYQLHGRHALRFSLDDTRTEPRVSGDADAHGAHVDHPGPLSSHTWWPRDIVAHVGACGACAEATHQALSAIDAHDLLQRRTSAARVSGAIHERARWWLGGWGIAPLTVYSTVWLADGDENWPTDRPRVPVSAPVRVPWDVAGLPDGDDPTALVQFERLAEARHHAFKAVFKAGVEPYGHTGLTLLSRTVRRNEEQHKGHAATLRALRDMRRQLFVGQY
ncbi:hypothetical protein pkur_cds_798 [Pandoravirus kuranda]|uniref:Uncharacterized protein n=1 Tax=Pandoravirus kuranda TaxID=3019033 RepID=A0AA95EF80_9VIRU|nr:hypothetical protein pkur_cds_798 [Pandoravirus kuranda]